MDAVASSPQHLLRFFMCLGALAAGDIVQAGVWRERGNRQRAVTVAVIAGQHFRLPGSLLQSEGEGGARRQAAPGNENGFAGGERIARHTLVIQEGKEFRHYWLLRVFISIIS